MSDLHIELWPLERLHSYGRQLKDRNTALPKMVEALRTWGFRVPLLVTADGEVVDGEVRLEAARELGLAEAPVIVQDDLTPTQVRTFRLLVNRSATWADWNDEALRAEMAELRLELDNLSLTGFSDRELDAFLAGTVADNEKDPDAVPEEPEVPTSVVGDVWLLGMHRLMCGDSTRPADVAALMAGEQADMVWTDPPYNVDYKAKAGKIKNDKMSPEQFDAFLRRMMISASDILCDGGAIYVAHSEAGDGMAFRKAFHAAGFYLSAVLIWRKNQLVLSRGDYHWQHEPVLYGWKPTGKHTWYGDRKQTTLFEHFAGEPIIRVSDNVWQVACGDSILRISGKDIMVEELASTIVSAPKPQKSKQHPTMKPVALVEKMLANSSPRGGLVADLCGGSGTTLIAGERLGRRCNLMDLDPHHVDGTILRWQEYTGKAAVHAVTGQPYAPTLQAARKAVEEA